MPESTDLDAPPCPWNLTDTWSTIQIGHRDVNGQMVYETHLTPPKPHPFRDRLIFGRNAMVHWDLLNGRMVRRPPAHRVPPEPFVSKQYDRFDGFLLSVRELRPSRVRRILEKRKPPIYWWGNFARMRTPARRGMFILNRRLRKPTPRYIPWLTYRQSLVWRGLRIYGGGSSSNG